MDNRLFVLHTSSYLYLVLSYMAAQGAFSWLAPAVPGGRTARNLLYMVFASAGMLAFGFFRRRLEARGRLFALLALNGAARAAMELLPPLLRAAQLCPATEDAAEAEERVEAGEEKLPPSPEDLLASWRELIEIFERELNGEQEK